jgi:FMN phosphatase YigB (HAD superfamily)
MPRPRIKAVVFDLGGVLIELHSKQARRELIDGFGIAPERFDELTRSCFTKSRRSITELAMLGRVTTSTYLRSFLRECNRKDKEGIRANRLSVIGRECRDTLAIVDNLRRSGTNCCILSNTIALHWDSLSSRRDYPSLGRFEHVFASHLIARAKPRRSAFSFVAKALKLPMSECLLVDDTLLNVESAKAAGWHAVLFNDADRLRAQLGKVGLRAFQ